MISLGESLHQEQERGNIASPENIALSQLAAPGSPTIQRQWNIGDSMVLKLLEAIGNLE